MKGYWSQFLFIFSSVAAVAAVSALAQQPRASRPQADIKVTYRVTMAGGQSTESTSMIKGERERTETKMGYFDTLSIRQCDKRQTIQLNDRSRKYIITPMDSDETPARTTPAAAPRSSGPARAGGDVTYVVSSIDTGERKEMFGFTARHVKTTMRAESSPDACNQQRMHMEQDGWYIDLNFGLNCEMARPPITGRPSAPGGGCQDRIHFRHVGQGRTGYPLIETTTVFGENDQPQFSTTKEVVELSRAPLDAALFDVPAGYTEAKSQQEMYGQPSIADIMKMQQQNQGADEGSGRTSPGQMGQGSGHGLKVGVVQLNNKANASVSMDDLREKLISEINGSGVDAISLNASSLGEAQIEAKAKNCDYILLTDVSTLKAASSAKRIGGILGGAVGAGTGGAGRSEAKFDFKLYPTGASVPTVSSSASAKEETQDASVSAVLSREAQTVVAAVRH